MLLTHMTEFISYYGYRLFEGINFSNLCALLDLLIGGLPSPEREALDPRFHRLVSPPKFVFMYHSTGSYKDVLD